MLTTQFIYSYGKSDVDNVDDVDNVVRKQIYIFCLLLKLHTPGGVIIAPGGVDNNEITVKQSNVIEHD